MSQEPKKKLADYLSDVFELRNIYMTNTGGEYEILSHWLAIRDYSEPEKELLRMLIENEVKGELLRNQSWTNEQIVLNLKPGEAETDENNLKLIVDKALEEWLANRPTPEAAKVNYLLRLNNDINKVLNPENRFLDEIDTDFLTAPYRKRDLINAENWAVEKKYIEDGKWVAALKYLAVFIDVLIKKTILTKRAISRADRDSYFSERYQCDSPSNLSKDSKIKIFKKEKKVQEFIESLEHSLDKGKSS